MSGEWDSEPSVYDRLQDNLRAHANAAAKQAGVAAARGVVLGAEALAATRSCTRETALSLLAGAVENLNAGCVGHMSEIADGDAPHAQKGCRAQAWSVSELLRVWLKLSA